MKNILISLILLLFVANTSAQDQKFSATAAFPIAVGDFEYIGYVDIGLQYRIIELGPVVIGASTNAQFLFKNEDTSLSDGKRTAFLLQPRVFGELNIASVEKLKPFLGLGYSWATFKSEFGPSSLKETDGGFNFNLGAAYDVSDTIFIHLQLDSTRFASEEVSIGNVITSTRAASTLNIIKLGVGLRF